MDIIVWQESCECGGNFLGYTEEPCRPDCAGYLPDEVETAKARLFATADRGHDGTTRMVFMNNGGRSKLMPLDHDGRAVALAPVLHRRIGAQVVEAAHVYARTAYGARRNWPARFTVERS
ncbi:hypothetical protein ACIG5E_34215 [Kitasatospora sp. NPDC053057]|uniref:hypothetical protein n=1 Tax=Kitasatospora sp. NPDC053057 TaxID=3364062 RepID=UPI0037C7A8FB